MIDPDDVYDIFRDSYERETGKAWSREKFLARARNWNFYGDGQGFIAVRPQQGGMKKLVGVAGDRRGVLKGIADLQAEGGPIWGAVSKPLAEMAQKRGFVAPHTYFGGPTLIRILLKQIPASVFGGVEAKALSDGGIELDYEDVGTAVKYLVANRAYFKKLFEMPHVMDALGRVPGATTLLKKLTSSPP